MTASTTIDYTSLIGPAVVAAVISGLVSGVGILISARTTRAIHSERLAFDREQSERRVSAEIALAEKKVTLDRALAAWKRKTELAEEVLADFYKARDIIEAARSPGGFGDEGATRQKQPWETEDDTRTLNAYFRTIERLNAHGDFFSQLFARSHRFIALFGNEARKPFDDLWQMRGNILIAVRMLITTHQQQQLGNLPETREKWEATIGWGVTGQDPIRGKLDAIVAAIENICRPVIQDIAP
jgi:hypothetical protein